MIFIGVMSNQSQIASFYLIKIVEILKKNYFVAKTSNFHNR